MYGRPPLGKGNLVALAFGWEQSFGLLVRSDDRWPRWETRIGLQALRRDRWRDDKTECPNPGPDHFAVAALCSLPGDRPQAAAAGIGDQPPVAAFGGWACG